MAEKYSKETDHSGPNKHKSQYTSTALRQLATSRITWDPTLYLCRQLAGFTLKVDGKDYCKREVINCDLLLADTSGLRRLAPAHASKRYCMP